MFEGVAIGLGATSIIFFYLYSLFRDKTDGNEFDMMNEVLTNIFFGFGLMTLDALIYGVYLYAQTQADLESVAIIVKPLSLLIILVTVFIAVLMVLKAFFAFMKNVMVWGLKKVGL